MLTTVALLPTLLPATSALRRSLLATVAAAQAGPTVLRVLRATRDPELTARDHEVAGGGRAKILRRQLRPGGANEKALHLEEPKHCQRWGAGEMAGWSEG